MRYEWAYRGNGFCVCLHCWKREVSSVLVALLIGLICIGVTGCEEGVREREVPKGVESVPGPSVPATPSAEAPSTGDDPSEPWAVPAGWERDHLTRQMRYATFMINSAPGGPVEVAITRFPGQVGGVLANVNRWRGQTGLQPVSEDELDQLLTRFGSEDASGYLLRLDGESGTMLAAGVYEREADRTWFVRVTTSAQAADAVEEDVFDFARSMADALAQGGELP